ncbi:hypothetical protein M514_01149 [Trichuris suis]|uniref:Uncharacterized protein n=1 Tax=Trichuris suis TaxID=68888 RepID=A0A085NN63_9BILA|nr:hypothetical protein M514_01149 [Trichuris suis]
MLRIQQVLLLQQRLKEDLWHEGDSLIRYMRRPSCVEAPQCTNVADLTSNFEMLRATARTVNILRSLLLSNPPCTSDVCFLLTGSSNSFNWNQLKLFDSNRRKAER